MSEHCAHLSTLEFTWKWRFGGCFSHFYHHYYSYFYHFLLPFPFLHSLFMYTFIVVFAMWFAHSMLLVAVVLHKITIPVLYMQYNEFSLRCSFYRFVEVEYNLRYSWIDINWSGVCCYSGWSFSFRCNCSMTAVCWMFSE